MSSIWMLKFEGEGCYLFLFWFCSLINHANDECYHVNVCW